jgi:hypothetical protein
VTLITCADLPESRVAARAKSARAVLVSLLLAARSLLALHRQDVPVLREES